MLHIKNYANGRFIQSQKLQNQMWTLLYKSDEIRIHSFREEDIRDIIHFQVESRDDAITKQEFPFFIEHRHDQALLTCMTVKHQIKLQKDPTQFSNDINPLIILHRGKIQ